MASTDCQTDPRERALVLRLRDERMRQKLSAAALAARTGLSRACITHLEANRARPTLATLLKISDGLGVYTAEWFSD